MRQRDFSRRSTRLGAVSAIAVWYMACVAASSSSGQDAVVKKVETAQPAAVEAAAQPAAGDAAKRPPEGSPADAKRPDGKPGEPKPGEAKPGETKPGETKPGEAKPAEPLVTPRPMKPTAPPNPDELKVRPNGDGKVRVNFNGQPWPAVLEWVASISNMSLDWQELPGDYLNLSTQQPYTVAEIRDLVNRHLLARGFTMLRQGEMLSVANIKKLDPGMVSRVAPAELVKRSPYEYVKVSFSLDWLMAETAAEELKPMLSPNGKLSALKSTNRLEAMDAVINLREIGALLKEEQSSGGQDRLVREFVLLHARAAEVEKQLTALLGLEDKSKKGRTPTPEELMMQQQQQMMMRGGGGGQPPPPPSEKPKGPAINLVVNVRKNSIVANAPPDKMAFIEQAIKLLDVQTEGAQQLLANMNKMQVYRLAALDPEPLVATLNELGVLDPSTRLEVDKKNRSIIAYAALADHVMIRAMVNKLDSSGRRFEVIPLRRLEADYVAGSIEFMMGGGEKEKSPQRRYYYDGYFGRSQQDEAPTDKFRVDADVENNRLLVWANQVELDEVMNLLAKLGEIPARGGNTSTVRVLQVEPGKGADQALERIRRAWPRLSPNRLDFPAGEDSRGAPAANSAPKQPAEDRKSPDAPEKDRNDAAPKGNSEKATDSPIRILQAHPAVLRTELAQADVERAAPPENKPAGADRNPSPNPPAGDSAVDVPDVAAPAVLNPARRPNAAGNEAPPITILRGPNGELIATSPDTDALDRFEEMMAQLAPQRRDYEVFYLKHASATWVALKLEDYFEVDDKKKSNNNDRFRYFFYDEFPQPDKPEVRRLSRRRKLKFISEIDTNTILVQGADPAQLKVIEELIELYDQPEPLKSKAARMTTIFSLKYSKAKTVADAVKDVYRDLLSSNDRALQGAEQQKNKRPESQNVYITNLGGESEGDEKRTQVSFKGKLSLGVDELSNTIVVSTEGENLMSNVSRMIEALDQAAKPALPTVQVVKLSGQMDSNAVSKAIARIVGEKQPLPNGQNGARPPWQHSPQQQPMQEGGAGNSDRNNPNGSNGQFVP